MGIKLRNKKLNMKFAVIASLALATEACQTVADCKFEDVLAAWEEEGSEDEKTKPIDGELACANKKTGGDETAIEPVCVANALCGTSSGEGEEKVDYNCETAGAKALMASAAALLALAT